MKSPILSAALLFTGALSAAQLPKSCSQALIKSLDSSATWSMERRLAGSGRTLVSTGTVSCAVGKGIVWTVLHPFPSSVSMTTNSMCFSDEDGERVKPLNELPFYAEIRRRTDAFANGDTKAFDGIFSLEAKNSPDGRWTIDFTPEIRAMRQLFTGITLSGSNSLTTAVLATEDGSTSTIRFKELPRAR